MIRRRTRKLGALIALFAFGVPTGADAARSKVGEAEIRCLLVGPAGLEFSAMTADLELSESAGVLRLVVPLAKLTTGIGLRDRHMREKYLETAKFPAAELVLPAESITFPTTGEAQANADGELTIHGRTKKVSIQYTARREGTRVQVLAKMKVDMNDFGIVVPSYLGVTVKPGVEILAKLSVEEIP